MDVHDKLDDLSALVENARAMPMSASCVVNRGQVLDLLDEVRALLPDSLAQADDVLADREELLDQARGEGFAWPDGFEPARDKDYGGTRVRSALWYGRRAGSA